MARELIETIDLSVYDANVEGEIEIYGFEPGTLGSMLGNTETSIERYRLNMEQEGEDYHEERSHGISGSNEVTDSHKIVRKTDSSELDPRILEEMHPSVTLGGPYRPEKINLDLRDPTVLIPQQERINEDREIYLRTYKGTGPTGNYFDGDNEVPHVEATIKEQEDGTTYTLSTHAGHMSAVARLSRTDKDEHMDRILKNTGLPSWKSILEDY